MLLILIIALLPVLLPGSVSSVGTVSSVTIQSFDALPVGINTYRAVFTLFLSMSLCQYNLYCHCHSVTGQCHFRPDLHEYAYAGTHTIVPVLEKASLLSHNYGYWRCAC